MRRGWTWGVVATVASVINPIRVSDASGQSADFSWDRATVYSIDIATFANGDPANDPANEGSNSQNGGPHTRSNGDFAGIAGKIHEGYFQSLGVDVLCLSSVFARPEGRADGVFQSLFPVDYATPNPAFGTDDDFAALVRAAHEAGLRVLIEAELPGREERVRLDSTAGPDGVDLQSALVNHWGEDRAIEETAELRRFLDPSGYPRHAKTVAVKWLADWVRMHGIDGLLLSIAGEEDPAVIAMLKAEGTAARDAWESRMPSGPNSAAAGGGEDGVGAFYVIGTGPDQEFVRTPPYDAGLDAMVFAASGDVPASVEATYAAFSQFVSEDPAFNVVATSVSGLVPLFAGHDPVDIATHLLLLPAPVVVYSGSEVEAGSTGVGSDDMLALTSGSTGASTSLFAPIDWDEGESELRAHWATLGAFRKKHPAIAGGAHVKLSDAPYAFYRGLRLGRQMDEVIVVLAGEGRVRLNVSQVFPDDTVLRDAYSGAVSMVSYGEVSFVASSAGVLLLERLE